MDEKITINSNGETIDIYPRQVDISTLREKAINSVHQMLDIENIAYIVYIDDKFDDEALKEEYIGHLLAIKNNGDKILSENFQSIEWSHPEPKFRNEIIRLWDQVPNKRALLFEVCLFLRDPESANVIPVLEIEECFGDRIKLMTPTQWVQDQYTIIKALKNNKRALCLFDFEFQNSDEILGNRNGAQLAKELIEIEDLSNKVVCGIFSHKFGAEDEDDKRNEYSVTYQINKEKFYTISKSRFSFDPKIAAFSEGIKNLLLLPYVEELKAQSTKTFKESNEKATLRIKEISPKTFNHIIQKSSLKEGIWEVSTLFRLYGILSKEENLRYISDVTKRATFNTAVKKIRDIDKIETGYNNKESNNQTNSLRESETYITGNFVNNLHLPISNGDIFKIKDKEYILLVQPCNLALRANDDNCGKRSYDYNNALLVPLKEGAKKKLASPAIEKVVKPGLIDKVKYADFSGFKNVPLDLLDLAVFQTSGDAILDMKVEKIANELIHFPWLERYSYIYKEFAKYEKALNHFKNIRDKVGANDQDIRALKPFIYAPECLKSFKINGEDIYDFDNRVFKFKIKRVAHYKSPLSDDLLQRFMQYLSRNAFEHDFSQPSISRP
ncbi:MAG TPA: hypothetical protein VNQ80_07725 [Parapedobacter sp.]|uniref:hypothetical protein n=1 Tax=Parapedobacter sp. TaxID=1958893 RepID=UPI002BC9DC1A|nr:hypothetical protein [Parapedobacter sp.]HWK57208.1 hypothetical protein [Parapedobacter sp.]